jgi:choline dehydrogenase-like flavoprotein
MKKGQAVGVLAKVQGGYTVKIQASRVVVSCGSIGSPALLLRSGLKNTNIGKHLRLHPVTTVSGIFPDRQISPYKGSIMTAVSNVVADRDGSGYGARLEVPAAHPSMVGTLLPWKSAADHKRLMTQYDHCASFIVLCRDRNSTGKVFIDKEGHPRVDFSLSPYDAESILQGVEAGINIMIAAGAQEIITLQTGVPTFKVPKVSDPMNTREYKKYVKQVRAAGIKPLYTSLFCAHQMGSCRMGSSPSQSVVDQTGETWECKDLFIADASLFPTASGANPMLTTFSLAYSVAQFLKKQMKDKQLHQKSSRPRL